MINIVKYSKISILKRILARILGIAKERSFKGGRTMSLTPILFDCAESLLIKEAQKDFPKELNKHFKSLSPRKNSEGIVVVGTRMSKSNPMTLDGREDTLNNL